jgi:hypothetical protein
MPGASVVAAYPGAAHAGRLFGEPASRARAGSPVDLAGCRS